MTNNDKTYTQNNQQQKQSINKQNTFNYRGRRLIENEDYYYDDDYYDDSYEDDENYEEYYKDDQYYDDDYYDDNYDDYYDELYDEFKSSDYAQKCTNRIPIIFKHLCVHWNSQNGFIFSYLSNLEDSKSNHHQTSWFYDNTADKIASAKVYYIFYVTFPSGLELPVHLISNTIYKIFYQIVYKHPSLSSFLLNNKPLNIYFSTKRLLLNCTIPWMAMHG